MARSAKIVLCVTKRTVGAVCIRKYAWRPFSVPRITFQRAKNEIPHREGSVEVREMCACVRARASMYMWRTHLIVYFREMRSNGMDRDESP